MQATTIYLVCALHTASPPPQLVMAVRTDPCRCKSSMSVGKYINKQIDGKESLHSADFDCSLPVPGVRDSVFPAPATQTQSLQKQDCPGAPVFSPLEQKTCTGINRQGSLEVKGLGSESTSPPLRCALHSQCSGAVGGDRLLWVSEQPVGLP